MNFRKLCRCCGRVHTLADATSKRVHVGIQRFDFVALYLFNCLCGSTLAFELFSPRIQEAS